MAQLAQLAQVGTAPVILNKGAGKGRAWSITWNNHSSEDLAQLAQYCRVECSDFIMQEETGEAGTPHIQAALYFKNARHFNSIKEDLPKCHIEMAKNWRALRQYCKKDNTRTGERIEHGFVKDPLEGKVLRPFQKLVMDILETKPDNRKIHWFWEPTGNVGKTTLCKHICLKYDTAIFVSGKAADMKCAVAEMVKKNKAPTIVILGLSRSAEDFSGSLYQGLEELKDGIFFSGKYESGMVMYDSPHVLVFANWEPDLSKLSMDRWNVVDISGIQDTPAPETPLSDSELENLVVSLVERPDSPIGI